MDTTQPIGTSGGGTAAQGFNTKMPATKLGKVAMWLAAAFVIGFGLNAVLVGVVGTSTNPSVNDFSQTYLPYWGIALFSCGFVAGVVALVAILKEKERSLLTLLTIVPALFVIVFLAGEFLLPH